MRLERVIRDASDVLTIEELKGYINVVSTDRDSELQAILNAAIAKIEDITDYSLTAQTLRLYVDDALVQRLFLRPVSEIVSVTNEETGTDCTYTANHSMTRLIFNEESDVVIEYKTLPNPEHIFDLKPYVYQYAALLYDGETDNAIIESVLRKIPRNIC
jgi:hypothetical protein